jgi:hypothetical protein
VADLLDNIHSALRARLQELRPLAAEYEQLEAALAVLASTPSSRTTARAKGSTARSSKQQARRQPSTRRAPRGRNKAAILEAIGSAPEATVSDLHEATGIDKPVIYNVTRKAIEDGEIERVVLAGGIQGFKVTPVEEVAQPRKPARRRSRRKRSAPAPAKPAATEAQADGPSDESSPGD